MSVRIITGDALAELRLLPDESVHCCVTSPPYFGLRDYQVAGQIGLEPSPAEYIAALLAVFREVRRVLRSDGTFWVVIGDSFAGSWGNQGRKDARGTQRLINTPMLQPVHDGRYPETQSNTGRIPTGSLLKPKDLIGIPWMVAFALRDDGWWLRQDIIWAKANPMPESVTDRCTKAHEYMFMLTKSARYYYDANAIAEPAQSDHSSGNGFKRNARLSYRDENGARGNDKQWADIGGHRNKRSVWTIATEPYPEAHFAVFPPSLVEPCILAGCPKGGVVLDPFGGAGTTALVADRLGRDAILIEINPDYAEMARQRIESDAGMFADFLRDPPSERPVQEEMEI